MVSAQAQRNAQDGISLVQTAEGALTEVHSMLQRVRDLAVQYKNGTLSTDDQDAIEAEVVALTTEITTITDPTDGTKFNGKALFGVGVTFKFQVGANDSETITANGFNAAGLALAANGISEITAISDTTDGRDLPGRRHRASRTSTRRSRTCPRPARTSARCRTASSTVWQPGDVPGEPDGVRERGSVTWTWRLR